MSAIEREWKLLMNVVEKLTDEQMSTPDSGGWSPKDNFAHITGWMKILMFYHMDKFPSSEVLGVSEETAKDWDFNEINHFLFERNKNRQPEDVLTHLTQKLYVVARTLLFFVRSNLPSVLEIASPRKSRARLAKTSTL